MNSSEILLSRLLNQQIAESKLKAPYEVVAWMGAMQAQDFSMAKWGIGLRLPESNETDVENAFNDGTILRTHVLRPTWHFVAPANIRWLLELTAPHVHRLNSHWYRKFELDDALFKRTNRILTKTLSGRKYLTRAALKSILESEKIFADNLRLSYIMMFAELEGIICSGPRQGKQFTYALLDERVPFPAQKFAREDVLAKLAKIYFTTRGPATIRDFVYWSGLSLRDAKMGAATLDRKFVRKIIDDNEYIFLPTETKSKNDLQTTFLMPDYDEYGMSYKNRSVMAEKVPQSKTKGLVFSHTIILEGIFSGTWNRTIKDDAMIIETTFFHPLNKKNLKAIADALMRYSSFFVKKLLWKEK